MVLTTAMPLQSQTFNYGVEVFGNTGNGDFAPYFIGSNVYGVTTQQSSALLRVNGYKSIDKKDRFSYGFGIDVVSGYSSGAKYDYFDGNTQSWASHDIGPSTMWLQQLYVELKYRSLFLTLGQKQQESPMLDNLLSSGDLTRSTNSRPMLGLTAGFIDFQDIPLTDGWVQLEGQLFFGKCMDGDWIKNHYNHYNSFYTSDVWFNYKRIHFRTRVDKPLSVTIGLQAAAQFAGVKREYRKGKLYSEEKHPLEFADFFKMIVPKNGEEEYYKGNHVGNWDISMNYRLCNGDALRLYAQFPWEDGSGMGKLNGFDGLWGIEYKCSSCRWVDGIVIEYLDFMNQSGPLHWDPVDNVGTNLKDEATGADSYYNNYFYNGYNYYGMSIGTPFIPSTLYNSDGYMRVVDTRLRGVHVGMSGQVASNIGYRLLYSYRKGYGDVYIPRRRPVENTSAMLEVTYNLSKLPGLQIKAQVAIDRGGIYGNNFGTMLSVSYNGLFNL